MAPAPSTGGEKAEVGRSRVGRFGEGSGRDETKVGDDLFMEAPQEVPFSAVMAGGRRFAVELRWSRDRFSMAPESINLLLPSSS